MQGYDSMGVSGQERAKDIILKELRRDYISHAKEVVESRAWNWKQKIANYYGLEPHWGLPWR
jgi:hypothetical protein